jgi:hypothetical protein
MDRTRTIPPPPPGLPDIKISRTTPTIPVASSTDSTQTLSEAKWKNIQPDEATFPYPSTTKLGARTTEGEEEDANERKDEEENENKEKSKEEGPTKRKQARKNKGGYSSDPGRQMMRKKRSPVRSQTKKRKPSGGGYYSDSGRQSKVRTVVRKKRSRRGWRDREAMEEEEEQFEEEDSGAARFRRSLHAPYAIRFPLSPHASIFSAFPWRATTATTGGMQYETLVPYPFPSLENGKKHKLTDVQFSGKKITDVRLNGKKRKLTDVDFSRKRRKGTDVRLNGKKRKLTDVDFSRKRRKGTDVRLNGKTRKLTDARLNGKKRQLTDVQSKKKNKKVVRNGSRTLSTAQNGHASPKLLTGAKSRREDVSPPVV